MSQNHDLAPASTALRRWSSRNYPPRDRLEGYLDQVEKSLFASSITPVASRDFHANLNEARFAHGRAVRFTATPHLVSRLTAEVAKTSEDTIVAGLHLSPGVRVKVKDVLVDRAQGDLVAIESSTQFSLETNRASEFSMLSLLFDARRIDGYAGRSRRQVWKLLGHQPATSTLRACIELFGRRFSQQAPAGELAALFDACEALVATVFIEDRDFAEATSRTRSNVRAGLLLAVIDYCEKNVRNPALSPLHVASAFGISTRYLHKLFEDDGTSFSTFVLNRRLDGVHAALTSENPNRLSIGDMSAFWGFENRATFNRNFKRRFQLTPSQATRRRVVE